MKTIKLALFRLLRYFEENRLIFVLYLLGSVTCVITFVYFYGNMMPNKHADARNSLLFRRYKVQLSKPLQLGTKDFAFLKNDPVEDIKLETPLLKELPGKSDDILAERGSDDYFNMQSYLYENTKIYAERGRTEFREEERNNGANVVMVPSDALRMFAGGKKLTLAGAQYETIGVATFYTGFIIPYRAYEKQAYPTQKVTVTTNRLLSIRESNDLTRRLYEKFPGSSMMEPKHLLVQNEKLFQENAALQSSGNFFVQFSPSASKQEINRCLDYMQANGMYTDYHNIMKNTEDYVAGELHSQLPIPLFFLFVSTVSLLCVSVLLVYKKLREYSIYYLCGCGRKKSFLTIALAIGLIALLAGAINVGFVTNYPAFASRGILNLGSVIIDRSSLRYLIGYVLAVTGLSVLLPFYVFHRESPIELYRRKEE